MFRQHLDKLNIIEVMDCTPGFTLRSHLQSRQAVVVCQLLSLLVTQVLDAQAEPQLLQRHSRHVVGHIINLRVQRERW